MKIRKTHPCTSISWDKIIYFLIKNKNKNIEIGTQHARSVCRQAYMYYNVYVRTYVPLPCTYMRDRKERASLSIVRLQPGRERAVTPSGSSCISPPGFRQYRTCMRCTRTQSYRNLLFCGAVTKLLFSG